MFSDVSILNLLIYAAGIGFAAAIIYTNIQRTALSKFISFLIDNNCLDEESAVSLDSVGLSKLQKGVIKSACKHQYGFKRSVACVDCEKSEDNGDNFFDTTDSSKYFLSDNDTDALKKKYSFKTMSAKMVCLFIVILIIVMIISSFLIDLFIKHLTLPKITTDNQDEINTTEQQTDPLPEEDIPSENDDSSGVPNEDTDNDEARPKIPT